MGAPVLTLDRRGAVVCATLSRPEVRNALNASLREALATFWGAIRKDDAVRAIVLAGAGPSFCAGRDRTEAHDAAGQQRGEPWYPGEWLLEKPVIAAIQGHCIAAGLQLALECDIRLCAEDATFSAPQAQLGMATRAPYVLVAAGVPRSVMMHMTLTGESLDADGALRHGLVSAIVPQEELLARAWATAEQVAKAPAAIVSGIKRASEYGLLDLPRSQALALWEEITLGHTTAQKKCDT